MLTEPIHWNSADHLPPVDCPILICWGGTAVRVTRTSYLTNRDGDMTYRLETSELITGRYRWTY